MGGRAVEEVTRSALARVWIVGAGDGRYVVRRHSPGVFGPEDEAAHKDLDWLHSFLTDLAVVYRGAPRPIGVLDGESWTALDGALWEATSYVHGEPVGWSLEPNLVQVGALLAAQHNAVAQMAPRPQRPRAFDSPRLAQRWSQATGPADPAIGELVADFDERRRALPAIDSIVIHGDFTTDNVIADGSPPIPVGAIDFVLAHVDRPFADVGYGLWRLARPEPGAEVLELARVREFVAGYHRVRPLRSGAASEIALFLWGRGIQMAVKAQVRGLTTSLRPQVLWIRENVRAVEDAIAAATKNDPITGHSSPRSPRHITTDLVLGHLTVGRTEWRP